MAKRKSLRGSIYLNKRRWWWRVKLPGDEKIRARPLKPKSAKWATAAERVPGA